MNILSYVHFGIHKPHKDVTLPYHAVKDIPIKLTH